MAVALAERRPGGDPVEHPDQAAAFLEFGLDVLPLGRLFGDRPVTLSEALAILSSVNCAGEETLLLLLLAGEEFALEHGGTAPARFFGELFKRAPTEIIEQLGEDLDELRPRWANGTAKLLARTLRQHVADLNRRGNLIEERFTSSSGA